MALGTCPDCADKVSMNADACPHCGNTHFVEATGVVINRECADCRDRAAALEAALRNARDSDAYFVALMNRIDERANQKECLRCHGRGVTLHYEKKDLRDGSTWIDGD
jgi:hypothetical protein